MHINHDLSSLTQLIISMFALAGVYVGFYLTMAKVEHVEQEISARQERLKECGVTNQELIDAYSQQNQQLNDILGQLITKDDSTL
jgi:flagellar biosynthesis/type III secretory pathway chaperone